MTGIHSSQRGNGPPTLVGSRTRGAPLTLRHALQDRLERIPVPPLNLVFVLAFLIGNLRE